MGQENCPPSKEEIESAFQLLKEKDIAELKNPLTVELMQARLLLRQLKLREKLPQRIAFDEESMRTLRQMKEARKEVLEVMVAFLLLLGESEDQTRACLHSFYRKSIFILLCFTYIDFYIAVFYMKLIFNVLCFT